MDAGALAEVPLFAGLTEEDRERIAARMREMPFPEGASLVEQGDLSYKFFVILEGIVEVIRDGASVADLGPGDFVGETGILAHERRNAEVVARSPVRVGVLIGWDVRELMDEYPAVRGAIVRAGARRSESSAP